MVIRVNHNVICDAALEEGKVPDVKLKSRYWFIVTQMSNTENKQSKNKSAYGQKGNADPTKRRFEDQLHFAFMILETIKNAIFAGS